MTDDQARTIWPRVPRSPCRYKAHVTAGHAVCADGVVVLLVNTSARPPAAAGTEFDLLGALFSPAGRAAALIGHAAPVGSMDLVADFARPLPFLC